MKIQTIFYGFLIVIFSISCDSQERFSKFENRITILEDSLSTLGEQIIYLNSEVWKLNRDKYNRELFENLDKIAYLNPGSSGYSTIKSDLGVLTVSLENVRPYANGSQVTLRWGNILNTAIDGLNMKVEYGSVDETGSPDNENAKSREFKMSESLKSGYWNNVNVVLEGIRPENLGFVRIREVYHSGIRLSTN